MGESASSPPLPQLARSLAGRLLPWWCPGPGRSAWFPTAVPVMVTRPGSWGAPAGGGDRVRPGPPPRPRRSHWGCGEAWPGRAGPRRHREHPAHRWWCPMTAPALGNGRTVFPGPSSDGAAAKACGEETGGLPLRTTGPVAPPDAGAEDHQLGSGAPVRLAEGSGARRSPGDVQPPRRSDRGVRGPGHVRQRVGLSCVRGEGRCGPRRGAGRGPGQTPRGRRVGVHAHADDPPPRRGSARPER